jgi:GNAT superfamily N-acetyltransferase
MVDLGLELPAGHRLVSIADAPELWRPMIGANAPAWPAFMLDARDESAARNWHRLLDDWPALQLCLLDADGGIVATNNAAPLVWDGSDDGLPEGWDDQFNRSAGDADAARTPNTLGAIQIVVAPDRQGRGLAATMVSAMRANAARQGLAAVIACVRPTHKPRYPLVPIERYATWTRDDELPFDPWLRLHVRLGGRIVRPSPRSMTYTATVGDWERFTGMAFPESGDYVIPGATQPIRIDRAADVGTYFDQNVWVVHDLGGPVAR